MKIGFREKIIIAAVALLVVVAAWYLVFYQSQLARIEQIRQETTRANKLIRDAKRSASGMNELEAEVDSLKAFLASTKERIRPKTKLLQITEEIQRHGTKFGLQITGISIDKTKLFAEESSASLFLWIPIEISLEGEFYALGNFLDDFPNYPFVIKPGEIKIMTDDADYPTLSIFLIAYVYVSR